MGERLISPDVCIMTRRELQEREDRAFQRGVERGKFEAQTRTERVSRNCANWQSGRCEACGAQHQYFEVGPDFKCPHYSARSPGEEKNDG